MSPPITFAALALAIATLSCDKESQHREAQPPLAAASRVGRSCDHPDSTHLTTRQVGTLDAMFSNDRKARRSTFGYRPPTRTEIALIANSTICAKADSAVEVALKGLNYVASSKSGHKGNLFVYRVGPMYALFDADQPHGDEVGPYYFFFDSTWYFLGRRDQ
jgi:hypothetical protein